MKKYLSKFSTLIFSATSRDSAASLAGNFGIAVGGMLFTIIVARSLSPDSFGLFSGILATVALLTSLGDLGISSALVNFVPKTSAPKLLISTIFWFQLVVSIILGAVLFVAAFFIDSKFLPGSTLAQVSLAALMVFLFIIENFFVNLLRAQGRFILASSLMVADSLFKLALIYIFYLTGFVSIDFALLMGIISTFIVAIWGLIIYLPLLSLYFSRPLLHQVFSFSKWVLVINFISLVTGKIDTILLLSLKSAFAAGIFAAANRMSFLFVLIISSLSMVVAPRFSRFTTPTQVKDYLKKISLLVLLVASLMLVVASLASVLVGFIFGPAYLPAVPVFRYLTLANFPFLLTILTISPLIYYFNDPKFVAGITVIQVVPLVVLDILLIPRLGPLGPAVALGVSQILTLSLTFVRLRYHLIHAQA